MSEPAFGAVDLDMLRRLDTCTLSNAIERLDVRPRNEGFVYIPLRCVFPQFPAMVGYAVTATIRSSIQPVGGGYYCDRIEWWRSFDSVPRPRVLILRDIDPAPGFGAFIGEVHAAIASALGCVGCVTNGAVRDLPRIEALRFQVFAGRVSPSHAYAHVVDWGDPVDFGGVKINSGDLIHGDRHGVLTVPPSVITDLPRVVEEVLGQDRELVQLCRSPDFSLETLSEAFDRLRTTAIGSDPLPAGRK